MRYMATYDLMETIRNTNQWLGASTLAMASYPAMAMFPNPALQWVSAWGEVTERAFSRMVVKPDWNIPPIVGDNGTDCIVYEEIEIKGEFGDLLHFRVQGRTEKRRTVLLVAPMSGHYATLLRSTVISLLPDCDLYITDWHNARDIPVSAGKFDIEDYTLHLVDYMRHLGPDTHVIAVCQPAPLTLAATAYLAEEDPSAQPRSLTLIGGPIDPNAAPTEVTDFGHSVTMGQLEELMIQQVGFKYAGVGRKVYPGLLQLSSFISMNAETHQKAFIDQIQAVAQGQAHEHDKHNKFYDEYLAVMDMPAEFYLSTVDRIFKKGEIAANEFTVAGKKVDMGKITTVAVKTVEGSKDDISAPGQCIAALDLCTGLPDSKKANHLEDGAGHYGIFAGKSWRDNIRPLVLDFIDANEAPSKGKAKAAPKTEKAANKNNAA
ncbi:polyhydroxyalkanoate depolymerase [Sulfitobacter donghicola]|uniref:Polyhydroxyalkanoate depolymerase n=1 Tax=Sulfitobacter donghicola DSW-25 = KCTC 12864 = JCM 14565 TaxID=1300350 RepID=A0A073IJN2_9RHOB|nr:polyhydroxyalkanoate depolymerase [Sulfitobacter donghicola]KEJ89969.1 polyhydroxyalkanoate depolymerase [Sulfitobacter donghicola DSW-25 = KCTC 12864 = JCM 14565]KIN66901.1 Polyhydroxyalkanoate depolymerase, intracellular [Sulfitobacter donghicola DSW-25 = KCTC 12864 = JCM 14565]